VFDIKLINFAFQSLDVRSPKLNPATKPRNTTDKSSNSLFSFARLKIYQVATTHHPVCELTEAASAINHENCI